MSVTREFGTREFSIKGGLGWSSHNDQKMKKNLHPLESPPSNIYILPIEALPQRNGGWDRTIITSKLKKVIKIFNNKMVNFSKEY